MFIPRSLSSKTRRNGAIIFALGLTTFLTVAATKPKPGQEDLRAASGGAGIICMIVGGGILSGSNVQTKGSAGGEGDLSPLEKNRQYLERCYSLKARDKKG